MESSQQRILPTGYVNNPFRYSKKHVHCNTYPGHCRGTGSSSNTGTPNYDSTPDGHTRYHQRYRGSAVDGVPTFQALGMFARSRSSECQPLPSF